MLTDGIEFYVCRSHIWAGYLLFCIFHAFRATRVEFTPLGQLEGWGVGPSMRDKTFGALFNIEAIQTTHCIGMMISVFIKYIFQRAAFNYFSAST